MNLGLLDLALELAGQSGEGGNRVWVCLGVTGLLGLAMERVRQSGEGGTWVRCCGGSGRVADRLCARALRSASPVHLCFAAPASQGGSQDPV